MIVLDRRISEKKSYRRKNGTVHLGLVNLFLENNIRLIALGLNEEINIIHFMPVWHHHLVVAEYVRVLSRNLQIGSLTTKKLYISALLHDVSKIMWDDRLHVYPYRFLTDDEKKKIIDHPKESVEIISKCVSEKHKRTLYAGDPSIVDMVLMHHEKPNGSGYYGITDIPRSAALLAVADVFDACTENRPYRSKNMNPDEAFKAAVEPYKMLFAEDEILVMRMALIWALQQRSHYTTFFFSERDIT